MADYFTERHFTLLDQWQGKKYDKMDPEAVRTYDDLKKAYAITGRWAKEVAAILFPPGKVRVVRKPTNQANIFQSYNWARIYPEQDSPEELAYTVGIAGESGFVVKIDTVKIGERDARRRAYLDLRGSYDSSSPIVATLSKEKGLAKSLPELVEWSIQAIRGFELGYEEVLARLEPGKTSEDEELLLHFSGSPKFD